MSMLSDALGVDGGAVKAHGKDLLIGFSRSADFLCNISRSP